MDFINIRAILVSAAIGVAVFFITNPLSCGPNIYHGHISDGEAMGFGFAAFLVCGIVLHIKPELMGKLNKSDEDANEEEN